MSDDSIFPLHAYRKPSLPQGNTNTNTNDGLSSLSSLSRLSMPKSRRLWATYSDDVHNTLRLICQQQGLTLDRVVSNIIIDYVRREAEQLFKTVTIQNLKVEGDMNIYQVIVSEEISQLCRSIKEGEARKAPKPYINDLREKLLKTLKQNPNISQELAEEVKAALTLLREERK